MLLRMMDAPALSSSCGESVFTAPYVPMGMKTGVGILPLSVDRTPQRAEDAVSFAWIEKFIYELLAAESQNSLRFINEINSNI